MDPFDRFHRRSLRDVLVAQGVISNEQADELIDSARTTNEPLGAVVLQAGHLTAWDLTKTVATHYQMPVLPLAGFRFEKELAAGLHPSLLHQHQLLPVGRFGSTWSFAVIEPPSRDLIEDLREVCGNSLFFFVADAQDLLRTLREHVKVMDVATDSGWQSIFDVADQNVKGVAPTPEAETPAATAAEAPKKA
jgi:hypothetical protein